MLSTKFQLFSLLIITVLITIGYDNILPNSSITIAQTKSSTSSHSLISESPDERNPPELLPQRTLTAPFNINIKFIPCGAMGDAAQGKKYVEVKRGDPTNSRPSSMNFEYKQSGDQGWAGWYWLYPDQPKCNWGYQPGTKIMNATKVTFWARGEKDGALIKFFVGGVAGHNYEDMLKEEKEITLTKKWQKYTINIPNSKDNLAHVIGAFGWSASKVKSQSIVLYLDKIQYE